MQVKTATVLLLLSPVLACGDQLVQFPNSAGPDDAGQFDATIPANDDDASSVDAEDTGAVNPDAADADARADGEGEATLDANLDADATGKALTVDAEIDAEVDAKLDVTSDADVDANMDVTSDANSADDRADVADVGNPDAGDSDLPDVTTSPCAQAPVMLGAAAAFAVLAGSTVTSTGLTSVTGDLGVSPGTAVTGFPPGIIVGNEHAGDPAAAQGEADLVTAYIDTAGRTLCAITVAGNLGGQTLTPGLYKSTSSLAISSGNLTLDGQGDPNAVFIFQMASTLTTTSGLQVILTGGAKATNVFWQVGSSATLGTTSAFQGTIMAFQAITLDTGAALNGRALAIIAAVALDGNTIVTP
jgi:ice-binding like protein